MKDITVKYDEIYFRPEKEQNFDMPLGLKQEEDFELVSYMQNSRYSLFMGLNLTFLNSINEPAAQINVKVPVEFTATKVDKGRELYPAYLAGYLAARKLVSSRFINSNIGFQEEQFLPASLQLIETKLTNALQDMINIEDN